MIVISQIMFWALIAASAAIGFAVATGIAKNNERARREGENEMSESEYFRRAVIRITDERVRQVGAEKHAPAKDLHYHQGELARAAACYAMPRGYRRMGIGDETPMSWPWSKHHWKPTNTPDNQTAEGRLRELEKAGALILAEMERIMARGDA